MSLLSGTSYTIDGGLNASVAGRGVKANAERLVTDEAWMVAAKGLVAQGVYLPQIVQVKERLKMDQFLQKYKEPGSETKKLEAMRAKTSKIEKDLEEEKTQCIHKCKSSFARDERC